MKTFSTMALTGALAGAVALFAANTVSAQSKTFQGETVLKTVTIEAIEQSTRTLTVKDEAGMYENLQVSPAMKRFSELKVGDKITARYYETVVVRLKRPGEPAVDVESAALTRGDGKTPAGTGATQRTITVTVTALDPKTSSVTVRGPNGYVYSRRATDKKAFAQLKVGDQLDMTWTEALLISAEPAK